MAKSQKRSEPALDSKVTFVLPTEDRDAINRQAKESGISVSAFLRKAAQFFKKNPRKAWDTVSRDDP